ncbi:MAG: UDP-N-acetylmuramate dehydrogenase [Saprospiraceae bacterium]|nr:UDP-N-acetylmuramate dehydrogenase [Saprospiraceae bacterium]
MISNPVSLKAYNTFGIDASCDRLIEINSEEELSEILPIPHKEVRVLGGGSNILLTGDLERKVLHNQIKGIKVLKENDSYVLVEVGGGHDWHQFVMWAVSHGYGGIENLSLIPGTVGAAPIQNIGAYGVEQSEFFVSLTMYDLTTGKDHILLEEDCRFGYRDSIFKGPLKGKCFITSVRYKLTKKHELRMDYGAIKKKLVEKMIAYPTIRDVSEMVIEIRKSKLPDPRELGNSGSFFKNPIVTTSKFNRLIAEFPEMPHYSIDDETVKIPAGWLIDQLGWKGKRIGDVGTYEKQALVLVNHGKATGGELWDFAKMIIQEVEDHYGIVLIPEVNVW